MSIRTNLDYFLQTIPQGVKLVAVSKTQPIEMIREAYDAGQRIFGENKVQDLIAKQPLLPADIKWHFIGHVQTNKVKFIAPFISLFHAVDSLKLFKEINKQALKNNRIIDCLLQFHIAEEETKFGLSMPEAKAILNSETYQSLKNIRVVGVMGMATFTHDENQVRNEFGLLKQLFDKLKTDYFINKPAFNEISMGMSGDYQLAIAAGSTMIRIGTSIFGNRNY
jgi:pyridoxal phosphate enzyme (YggS family)